MLARATLCDFSHSEAHLGTAIFGCLMRKRILIVSSGILAVLVAFGIYASMQVHATPGEEARPLAGYDLIAQPLGSVNHAITIHRPPRDVWPWLAQMGSGRAGWYTYDFIDNRGQRSAERILPEYQNIGVGSVLPALPGARDVFLVAQCEMAKAGSPAGRDFVAVTCQLFANGRCVEHGVAYCAAAETTVIQSHARGGDVLPPGLGTFREG